jgi:hypothetical protein
MITTTEMKKAGDASAGKRNREQNQEGDQQQTERSVSRDRAKIREITKNRPSPRMEIGWKKTGSQENRYESVFTETVMSMNCGRKSAKSGRRRARLGRCQLPEGHSDKRQVAWLRGSRKAGNM